MKNFQFIIITLLLIGSLVASESFGSDYFPLHKGRISEYKFVNKSSSGSDMNISFTETNLGFRVIDGKKTSIIKYNSGAISYVFKNRRGALQYAQQGPDDIEPKVLKQTRWFFKYPLKQGTTWTNKEGAPPFRKQGRFDVTFTIENLDDFVAVYVGAFENCLRIKLFGEKVTKDGKLTKNGYVWYAPDIGLVKAIYKYSLETKLGTKTAETYVELSKISN